MKHFCKQISNNSNDTDLREVPSVHISLNLQTQYHSGTSIHDSSNACLDWAYHRPGIINWEKGITEGHHFISEGEQGLGDRPKHFFHYIYFFSAAWSSNYLFQVHFIYDFNYILKAIRPIYFNSWHLQIIYFTIFLP